MTQFYWFIKAALQGITRLQPNTKKRQGCILTVTPPFQCTNVTAVNHFLPWIKYINSTVLKLGYYQLKKTGANTILSKCVENVFHLTLSVLFFCGDVPHFPGIPSSWPILTKRVEKYKIAWLSSSRLVLGIKRKCATNMASLLRRSAEIFINWARRTLKGGPLILTK